MTPELFNFVIKITNMPNTIALEELRTMDEKVLADITLTVAHELINIAAKISQVNRILDGAVIYD